MIPYPWFYTPGDTAPPSCCPHQAPFSIPAGAGPDKQIDADGTIRDVGGRLWGIGRVPDGIAWIDSGAGWFVAWHAQSPQDLSRLNPHPRVLLWRWVTGGDPSHRWRIPVLIAPDPHGGQPSPFLSALDRILGVGGWQEPPDLEPLQRALLALTRGERQHADTDENNAALMETVSGLIALGSWCDLTLAATQPAWITDQVCTRILRAGMGLPPDPALPEVLP